MTEEDRHAKHQRKADIEWITRDGRGDAQRRHHRQEGHESRPPQHEIGHGGQRKRDQQRCALEEENKRRVVARRFGQCEHGPCAADEDLHAEEQIFPVLEIFGRDLLLRRPLGQHQGHGVEAERNQRPDDQPDVAGDIKTDDGGEHDEKRHEHRALKGLGDVHGQHFAFIGFGSAGTLLQAFTRRLHRVENRFVAVFFRAVDDDLVGGRADAFTHCYNAGDMNPCRLRAKS